MEEINFILKFEVSNSQMAITLDMIDFIYDDDDASRN